MANSDKWALITGVSAGGLGDALAKELLSNNINVIITGLLLSDLDYFSNITDSRVEKLELDVTSTSSIASAVKAITELTGGKLEILVNNAGYGYMMPFLDVEIDKMKQNFDVNVFGLLAVTQSFFPLLRAAKGMVVNQASIAGLSNVCQPFIGTYSATKTAVLDLSNTLRVELAPFGVKVITLVTGDVRTQFWNNTGMYHVGLPESSLYAPIKAHVEEMMNGRTNPPGQHTADRWARGVVKDLLRSSPPVYVRRGFLATTLYLASVLLPVWLVDWMFTQSSKFGTLKGILAAEDSKKVR